MIVVCIIFSLFANGDINKQTKPFDSLEECQAWAYRQAYLSPYEGIQSWYYCEESET